MRQTNYVLVTTEPGKEAYVRDEIGKIPGAKAHATYGLYDVFVQVETDSLGEFGDILSGNVRNIKGVRGTLSSIVPSDKYGPVGFTRDDEGFAHCHPSLE
jgi:DNA-binding Lrp family transcriptional regulator